VTFQTDGNITISLRLCFPINCRTRHCIHSQCRLLLLARVCFCVVDPFVCNMAHISLWYISTIHAVPLFCYIIHKIAIRFLHWSSRATPGIIITLNSTIIAITLNEKFIGVHEISLTTKA